MASQPLGGAEARRNKQWHVNNCSYLLNGGGKPLAYFCMMLTTRQEIKAVIHWSETKKSVPLLLTL